MLNTIGLSAVIFGFLLLQSGAASDSSSPSPVSLSRRPSDWRIEDRLVQRTDPQLLERRLQAAKTAKRLTPKVSGSYVRTVDVIDGALHPELYLPHELFEGVVRRGFVDPEWRMNYDLLSVGLPPDFWEQMEALAASYIGDLRLERKLLEQARSADRAQREATEAQLAGLYATTCSHRADALSLARVTFGAAFDRFLYDVIAREKITFYGEPHDVQRLMFESRGCR